MLQLFRMSAVAEMQSGLPVGNFPSPVAPLWLSGRARRAAVAALLVLAGLPASRAAAQRTSASLVGVVRNRQTGAPVEGAIARLAWTGRSVAVDSAGRFELAGLKPGTGLLQIRAIGYVIGSWAVTLAEDKVVADTFEMDAVAIELPPLEVLERPVDNWRSPEGFEQRRRKGGGYFITEQQIKEQQPLKLVELLRTVPGVYTACNYGGCRVVMERSTPPCPPVYYLDGFPATLATGPDFPIQGIRGIEVYGDALSTPSEFQQSGLRCGIIAIWTRMHR